MRSQRCSDDVQFVRARGVNCRYSIRVAGDFVADGRRATCSQLMIPFTLGGRAPVSQPNKTDCECVTTTAGPILSSSAIRAPLMTCASSQTGGTRCCRNESTARASFPAPPWKLSAQRDAVFPKDGSGRPTGIWRPANRHLCCGANQGMGRYFHA